MNAPAAPHRSRRDRAFAALAAAELGPGGRERWGPIARGPLVAAALLALLAPLALLWTLAGRWRRRSP